MVWNPWKPTPGTRRIPLKVRSDREPIAIPIPRVGSNPPDDPDTAITATAAVPSSETTSRETTQSVAERIREASRGRSRVSTTQRTRTTVSVPVTATAETTSQTTTTSPARALVERIGNEAGEYSKSVQLCRIAALMEECEDTIASDAIADAR